VADRFPKRLRAVSHQPPADDPLKELHSVVDDYLVPAALELQRAAHRGDVDAIRAYGLELLTLTGSVIAACALPPTARRLPRPPRSRGTGTSARPCVEETD
jgi:hypothetical protein